MLRPRSGQHLEQHLNHSCLYKLPELRPSPSWSPCRTFSSTTRHRLRFARKTGPPSPLFVAHTLCPSVWPERTQMEAHSVSAAPHNCADESESLVVTNTAELNGKGGPRCCARASFCLAFAFVVLSPPYVFPAHVVRAALDWIGRCSLSGKCSCVFFKSSVTRRSASQVCVPQLVLWIRPMTHTSYKPAISQHQGGPAPLPTRRGPASARRSRAGRAQSSALQRSFVYFEKGKWWSWFCQLNLPRSFFLSFFFSYFSQIHSDIRYICLMKSSINSPRWAVKHKIPSLVH